MNIYKIDVRSATSSLFVVLVSILLAVWPFPGTIAVRQIAMLLAVILGLFLHLNLCKLHIKSWSVLCLGIFYVWVLTHFFFYSQNESLEYHQLLTEWIRIFVSNVLGVMLACWFINNEKLENVNINWILIIAAFLSIPLMIIFFNWSDLNFSSIHNAEFWQKPYNDKHSIVFYGVTFIACCFATLWFFSNRSQRIFVSISVTGIFIYLFTFLLTNTKNGFGVFVIQFLFFVFIILINGAINKKIVCAILFFVAIFGLMTFKHLDRNSSWKQLIPDIQIGYQIETYPHWQRYEYGVPKNKNGELVSITNYERSAWGAAGLTLLIENPMGYGLIKQSFGHLAQIKWPNVDPVKVKSTHSGWIDFALALGFPGIFLVFLNLFFSLKAAWGNRNQYWGILSLWVLPTTIFVWLVAELCVNHFVEMLFLILGFFAVINSKPEKNELPMGKN